MHVILVTFRPEASESELMAEAGPRMKAEMGKVEGLIMKTFVASSPERWGGFYLFADRRSADGYLAGEFFQWFSNLSLISDVQVEHFEVDDGPSVAFGTPSTALAETRAA